MLLSPRVPGCTGPLVFRPDGRTASFQPPLVLVLLSLPDHLLGLTGRQPANLVGLLPPGPCRITGPGKRLIGPGGQDRITPGQPRHLGIDLPPAGSQPLLVDWLAYERPDQKRAPPQTLRQRRGDEPRPQRVRLAIRGAPVTMPLPPTVRRRP